MTDKKQEPQPNNQQNTNTDKQVDKSTKNVEIPSIRSGMEKSLNESQELKNIKGKLND
ncbi:MAG TPA: hypothetical protein VHD83_08490 [Puia sp.]|nr:hypothetical protein [Puia sp.]